MPPVPEILLLVDPGPERRPALCHPPDPELGPDGQPHWLERRGAEFPCGLTFRGMASAGSPHVLGEEPGCEWVLSPEMLPIGRRPTSARHKADDPVRFPMYNANSHSLTWNVNRETDP